jgi:hypothetical protein
MHIGSSPIKEAEVWQQVPCSCEWSHGRNDRSRGGNMTDTADFEKAWLEKLSHCLQQMAGNNIRQRVMEDSESLSVRSSRTEVIQWTRQAMQRLDQLLEEDTRRQVMTGCACQYPKADLSDIQYIWQTTGDLDRVHRMLQSRFESFLKTDLHLDEGLIVEVIARGWGLAGVRQGTTIIATKIPKSSFIEQYLAESDPDVKRQYYCHCPRIRDVIKSGEAISPSYCYCGAGYYKGIWEEILQEPVEVELLESVLQGDQVCRVAVHLPLEL